MASAPAMELPSLVAALGACQSPDPAVRKAGEDALNAVSWAAACAARHCAACRRRRRPPAPLSQDEIETSREDFIQKYGAGGDVRREDLVIQAHHTVRCVGGQRRRRCSGAAASRRLPPLAAALHASSTSTALPPPLQDDPTDQIFVFFPDEAKVGVKTIKSLAERMRNDAVQKAILVRPARGLLAQTSAAVLRQCSAVAVQCRGNACARMRCRRPRGAQHAASSGAACTIISMWNRRCRCLW